jgi:cob(I)alamin adenosyltransferase
MALKIYTKQGDKGMTSLFGGTKLSKNHIRIEAYGTVDELNAFIGLLRDHSSKEMRKLLLHRIQENLFTIGSNLAVEDPSKYKMPSLNNEEVFVLEKEIDSMDSKLPTLKNFILPGGHQVSSYCHLARVVCRRAERRVVALAEAAVIDPIIIEYLNRLSDFLFVLSRMILIENGSEEVYWKPES